jgi:predicted RNA binding protein YcfA (HicA-like mRNA interferase family)
LKRTDLLREIEKIGVSLSDIGGKHDWYQNPKSKAVQPIPRHREINNNLAKNIIKKLT